ncbi:hypothetical protein [Pseudomonas tussilaginis]|uniref:hypothetical protein n=1 Tax=Pseudomonas putida TaxID=303 RepID=UPI002363CF06|nr:hypothetical protein [Pseudomonas putida]MDD1976965.1 hypothetical protein [Pseudomonas putida]
MKLAEKVKAQKLLKNIESGSFDENDVEMLLMRLRPYAGDNHVFREAADFVAHNDERYKGLVNHSLDGIALSMKFFQEYGMDGKAPLDMTKEFPGYIKSFLLYQTDKYPEAELREKCSLSRRQAREIINDVIKNSPTAGYCVLKENLKPKKLELLRLLFSMVISKPVFTRGQFLSELKRVVYENDIELDEAKFDAQADAIIVLFALLIHEVPFKLSFGCNAVCHLYVYEQDQNPTVRISGTCNLGEGLVGVSCSVFDTELPAAKILSESLLVRREVAPGYNITSYDLNRSLHLVNGLLWPINI